MPGTPPVDILLQATLQVLQPPFWLSLSGIYAAYGA